MDSGYRWDDLRVAYQVAESGSLSRAGKQLGINHTTVLRAVNRLEQQLNLRLFIRHQRGYQLTDAGHLMLEKMRPIVADMQLLFNTLSSIESSPSGTLRISTVSDFSAFFAPLLHGFRQQYPQIRVQIVATDDVLSLASGDIHVAIRIGQEPREPDIIAKRLISVKLQYYAAQSYIDNYGVPRSLADVNRHLWVMPSGEKMRLAGIDQVFERLDFQQVAYQSNSFNDIESAIREGMGIGPLSMVRKPLGLEDGLQVVDFGLRTGSADMWFVYHKDLRQSTRIRALQDFLIAHLPAV